jgi:peptidoglycan hydrolase CwlO-like protein
MSLSEMVSELEDDYEELKTNNRHLEEQLDDVEQDLETKIQQLNELQAFKDWVEMAYPEVVKDYGCVKIIEEVANGL